MRIITLFVVVALMMGDFHAYAQIFRVEYTSELQTNFRESNFVNLLRFNAEVPISRSMTIGASTISVAKTRDEKLVDDLQTFSNIEEDDLPLALALCGIEWKINDKHSFFAGIRNMNEDYFTTPVTSFFTNSSCGVYPTTSANYPIANYPMASVGMHYCCDANPFKLQASLYNGTGYNRFVGRSNVFRFCPKSDGIFGVAEVTYAHGNTLFSLGNSLYGEGGVSFSPWIYAEQGVCNNFALLVGYSHAFAVEAACVDYAGMGACYKLGKCQLGVFTDYAAFEGSDEFATELTCKVPLSPFMQIQPTAHFIYSDGKSYSVAMLRMTASF